VFCVVGIVACFVSAEENVRQEQEATGHSVISSLQRRFARFFKLKIEV
jgi:hypothetical protein